MCKYTCTFTVHVKHSKFPNSHFLDKHGLRVGEDDTIDTTERGSWIEEVDSEVSVVSFFTLADVLEREGGERKRASEYSSKFTLYTINYRYAQFNN